MIDYQAKQNLTILNAVFWFLIKQISLLQSEPAPNYTLNRIDNNLY